MIRVSRKNKNSVIKTLLVTVSFLSLLTACFDDRNNTDPTTNTPIPSITTISPENLQTDVNIYQPITVKFNVNIIAMDKNVILLRYQSGEPTNFKAITDKTERVKVTTKVYNSKLTITPIASNDPNFVEYIGASRYILKLVGISDVVDKSVPDTSWQFATAVDSINTSLAPNITRFTLDTIKPNLNSGQSTRHTLTAEFANGTGIITNSGNPDSVVLGSADATGETFTVNISPVENTIYTLNVVNRRDASAKPKTVVYNQAGQFAFEVLSTDIKETAGVVTLRVLRLGGNSGSVSVQYKTNNSGTATANSDYTSVPVPSSLELPTLVFPDNSATSQFIEIVITNDQLVNELPIETFSVSLLNPLGGAGINSDMSAHQVGIINDDILSVDFGIKQLNFSWTKYPGAIKYNLLEQTKGQGFNLISVIDANSIARLSKSIDISIYQYDWLNSSYMLEACDSNNACVSSNTVITANQNLKTIGLLKPSTFEIGNEYNRVAVSANGQVLVVGSLNDSSAIPGIINTITGGVLPTANNVDKSAPYAGAVYVFNRRQNETGAYGWQQTAYIKPSNPETLDWFADVIALSDDGRTLVVSANNEASNQAGVVNRINGKAIFPTVRSDDNSVGDGAVYIFTHQVDGWVQQAYIKSSDIARYDSFGSALALSGDGATLAVGASLKSSGANVRVGQVYLFKKSNLGWVEDTILKPGTLQDYQGYGESVALNHTGDVLVVGATGESNDTGAVYYYRIDNTQSPASWSLKSYLKPSTGQARQSFGRSVALSDDGYTLAVGAIDEKSNFTGVLNKISSPPTSTIILPIGVDARFGKGIGAGAVYIFGRNKNLNSNNFLVQYTYIKASNPDMADRFGEFIALSGDGLILAVSAIYESSAFNGVLSSGFPTVATDANTIPKAGAVYLYTRNKAVLGIYLQDSVWTHKAFIKAKSTGQFNVFGNGIALAGKQQANGKIINNGSSLVVGSGFGVYLY